MLNHKEFDGGNRHRFTGLQSWKDEPVTLHVVEKGEYEFGPATTDGICHPLFGNVQVDGVRYSSHGNGRMFKKGERLKISCEEPSVYIIWGNE
ncbi:hypothetical protein HYW59_03900 [Candidatus Kaiserbacteria bacterium]|nr:hypothetical protein [Candidatus Kaiserbacteria bacterium]